MSTASATDVANEKTATAALLRRIGWRLLPLLLVLYLIAYLDRVNIGFAASAMQRDLHFSDALYGTGAGVFFLGYFVAQVPSNLLLSHFGARRTIAALMVAWSIVSGAMAFVHSSAVFLSLRFLLGIAEAGFYPGVILYLTRWLPRRVRTSYTGWFIFAIPLASIFGGPLSTWILQHGAIERFHDWQVLLLAQAAPALLMGALLPLLLSDTPLHATWLSDVDRAKLEQAREEDEIKAHAEADPHKVGSRSSTAAHLLRFASIYFAIQFALYAQTFWLPKILQSLHVQEKQIGWDVAFVYAIAAALMIAWGRIADRSPKSRWPLGVPLVLGVVGYASCAAQISNITLVVLAFGVAAAGGLAATSPFWAQMTLGQSTRRVPILIAIVNALGNLGGFAGPALLGRLKQTFGSHAGGMLVASAFLFLACVLLYTRPSSSGFTQKAAA